MTFDATPLDGSTPTPIPMASAVPTGTTTPLALEGGPAVSSAGNLLTPVSTYVKNGNNLVEGDTTDAAVTGDTAGTLSAKMRGLSKILASVWDSTHGRLIVDGSSVTQPVSGTFWQATQPVSIATMPSTPVTGTFWQATQPVSLASLPALAAGSALIGGIELVDSAGTNKASISAGGALKVDGSAVTQPVSGTFWQATQPVSGTITANIGTTNGLALDASVGKLTIAQGATLGSNAGPLVQGSVSTAAPAYTSGQISPLSLTPAGAVRTDASAVTQPVSGTFWQATQPVSGTVTANQGGTWNITTISGTVSLPTGAATSAKQPAPGTAGAASSDVLSVQGIASMTPLKVDGSGVTQPVSITTMPSTPVTGTFWQATQPVSLAALPALAAGSALVGGVELVDGAGTNKASISAGGALKVDNSGVTQPVSGTFWQATQPVSIASMPSTPVTGTFWQATQPISGTVTANQGGTWTVQPGNTANTTAWKVDGSAVTQPVSLAALPALVAGSAVIGHVINDAGSATIGAVTQGAGAAAGTSWRVAGDFTEQTSLSAGSLNADLVPSTDVSAYKSFSIQLNTSAYVGTLTFQASNDNSTWNSVPLLLSDGTAFVSSITSTTSSLYFGSVNFRYLRVRMTAYTSGTAQGTLELYTSPSLTNYIAARQTGTWTVQPGNTQNTTTWLTQGAKSNSTAAANAGTGKAIKASAGVVWSVVVTTLGTAATTLFDNASAASGTALLTIPASTAVGTIYNFPGGAPAANGIFADQVANAPSITIYYF